MEKNLWSSGFEVHGSLGNSSTVDWDCKGLQWGKRVNWKQNQTGFHRDFKKRV